MSAENNEDYNRLLDFAKKVKDYLGVTNLPRNWLMTSDSVLIQMHVLMTKP